MDIPTEPGHCNILNAGHGDIKLVFDKNNPAEMIRAGRIVKDMLRRGYALMVRVEDGTFRRVHDFDEGTSEYIVADLDTDVARAADAAEGSELLPKRRGKGTRRMAASTSTVGSVPRPAGG